MDIIFPEYEEFHTKVVFYRIPKNASTSIFDTLGYANLIAYYYNILENKIDNKIYKNTFDPSHVKPDEFKNLVIGNNLKNYFSFCVVRDPWDRALSMYLHAIENNFKNTYDIKKDVDFNFFCNYLKDRKNDPNFIGSHKQTEWTVGKYPPCKILRFENISEDFEQMVNDINLVTCSPNLPHKNKTSHAHYSEYYNSETKTIISEVFEEDIDIFKYSFIQKKSIPQIKKDSINI